MTLAALKRNLASLPGWHFADLGPVPLPQEQLTLALLQAPASARFQASDIGRLWQQLPYWAFAWAAGRALACWLADNPEWIHGKRVLDFGCGSGIAGIQAGRLGASDVMGWDTDPLALEAAAWNARQNQVDWRIWQSEQDHPDIFLGSDLLYDPSCRPALQQLCERIPAGLIAEPVSAMHYQPPVNQTIRRLDRITINTEPRIGDFDQAVEVDILALEPEPNPGQQRTET